MSLISERSGDLYGHSCYRLGVR